MHLLNRLLNSVARAPDDGGGAGSGASNADPAAAASPAAGAPPAAQPSAAAGTPSADGGTPPAAAPEGPYRPDGLADNLYGKTDRETIDHLAKALKGYRDRDAKGGGVPEDAKGYLADIQNVPEKAKGYFDALAGDPVFNKIGAVAKEHGIPKAAFGALVGAFLEGNVEAGMFEPIIDTAAERMALIPDGAKALPKAEQDAAIDKRMNDNIAWVDAMVAQGMPKEAAEYLKVMTFDTAKGHQAVEFFRARLEGGGIKPIGGGQGGGAQTKEALKKEMVTNPKYQPGAIEYDAKATRELQEQILKLAST